jgi:hydrogenase nickel incorporation protein HypA/HybF
MQACAEDFLNALDLNLRLHEMSIAASILDAVRSEAEQRPGSRILKVGVKLGELAGVDRESLSFCFEALVKDSDLEPLELALEYCPRRNRCLQCGETFAPGMLSVVCPDCGSSETVPAGGDELNLAYMEVEEP